MMSIDSVLQTPRFPNRSFGGKRASRYANSPPPSLDAGNLTSYGRRCLKMTNLYPRFPGDKVNLAPELVNPAEPFQGMTGELLRSRSPNGHFTNSITGPRNLLTFPVCFNPVFECSGSLPPTSTDINRFVSTRSSRKSPYLNWRCGL